MPQNNGKNILSNSASDIYFYIVIWIEITSQIII